MKVTIGKSENRNVHIDLDTLISSRLLIQANSGGGKSWALRRLMEQAFGKVQIICIDPEGEFATLREKYGFVLVGPGGETSADTRSAGEVAEKLLELQASAVCDIYELKAAQRHQWVRIFLDALINAPKRLWHPALIVVDEAHVYCPEKGQGESEAVGAMTDLCTRGRKRGFCAVFATQRLGKLSKNASAELQNRMIGPTFEDIDRKRAADLLGVLKSDEREFFKKIQLLESGNFFALGRAISTDTVLVHVGDVETTHPQSGSKAHASGPPPAPEAIQRLLPQLADLPKQAEEKARTIADLQKELRSLKAQLSSRKPETVVDERAMLPLRRGLEDAMKIIAKIEALGFEGTAVDAEQLKPILEKAAEQITRMASFAFERRSKELETLKAEAARLRKRVAALVEAGDKDIELAVSVRRNEPYTVTPSPRPTPVRTNGNGSPPEGLRNSHVKILSRLEELLQCTGRDRVRKEQLAAWAEYSPTSGGYNNCLGTLRTAGMIDYPEPGHVAITEAGRSVAQPGDTPTDSSEMLERAKRVLGGGEGRLLEAIAGSHPEPMSKSDLATAVGFSETSGGFNNYLGHMRTLGFIDYPQRGMVRAADWLFI